MPRADASRIVGSATYSLLMPAPQYPAATRLDVVDDLFGHRVPDPYRWLEDPATPAAQEWLAGQDRLARTYLDPLPWRSRLRTRLQELLAAGVITAPSWRGARSFFQRRTAEQEHAVLLVGEADGAERTLLDPAGLDPAARPRWMPGNRTRKVGCSPTSCPPAGTRSPRSGCWP
jgi:Serine proteases of the peptidase family S9A